MAEKEYFYNIKHFIVFKTFQQKIRYCSSEVSFVSMEANTILLE